jgi:arylsulfatase A-like enzyme
MSNQGTGQSEAARCNRPNVILVLTDDQGYGDLGCTGNPWIRTPNIDSFSRDAVRCQDFHVSPLCTPTRGAIMTGHLPVRNGAWATCWGRSLLRRDEVTMADVFAASGYRTGMFGKWHLGDNYPYRPQDRGFQKVVAHKGGGVGQTPDFWGNSYFDDTYFHNGEAVAHEGYCTDVWFKEAMGFIDECGQESFFCYLATNAPHSPYLVADRYTDLYRDNPDIPEPAFYGMITNIDENFGRLRAHLQQRGLEDRTILIFMTDNGSSGGSRQDRQGFTTQGYSAGLRGMKASYYDGGHRVPFYLRWPEAGMSGGREVQEMALHVDLLPTFVDLCGLQTPQGVKWDGTSLASLLRGEEASLHGDRVTFVQYRQNTEPPDKWENAVMTRQWRLVRGAELYDIKADPQQRSDVAADHPEVVARLRAAHEEWWEEISPLFARYCPICLGSEQENPTRLNAMDVLGDVAWHQGHIVAAQKATGRWAVEVERAGRYRFSLRRWPEELPLPIDEALSREEADKLGYARQIPECRALHPVKARLRIFDEEQWAQVEPGVQEVRFELPLDRTGETQLEAWFVEEAGEECGAYYVVVERLS